MLNQVKTSSLDVTIPVMYSSIRCIKGGKALSDTLGKLTSAPHAQGLTPREGKLTSAHLAGGLTPREGGN